MDFFDKKVLIVGLARSGIAAAKVLYKKGACISAYDSKGEDQIAEQVQLLNNIGATVYAGETPVLSTEKFDLLVISPGVPLDIPLLKQADELGIKIIGELELAYLLKAEKVEFFAITGTNGKTTTTSLLWDIMKKAGKKSVVAGNIGIALCSQVDKINEGLISVEVSSFQLETADTFRPHVCGILNITPDHLDRHKTMQGYVEAKAKIFAQQHEDDFLVLNYEDELVRNFSDMALSRVVFFSTEKVLDEGAYVADNAVYFSLNGKIERIGSLDNLMLRGKHNLENILCAVAMAKVEGISTEAIEDSLGSFKGVRHRLEEVANYNGILYINDSKGTNPDSTIKALEAFDNPIVLIAGGRDKGGTYQKLAHLIKQKVKAIVLLGEARELIKSSVMDYGFENIYEVEDFAAAVYKANELADSGDVVLLSPACASWDMFPSYEHRGDLFCKIVRDIINN